MRWKANSKPEMTSLLYSSGLNFQGGNPLGRKVRALEAEVESLRKDLNALKAGGVVAPSPSGSASAPAAAPASSAFTAELDMLKREIAILKAAGFGKGEKGDKGDKGDKGEKGDPGPMTYIAMPSSAAMPMAAPATAPGVPAVTA